MCNPLRYNFVWQTAWYDLHDGFTTLIQSFIEENKAMFAQQRAIHIVLVLIMVRFYQNYWECNTVHRADPSQSCVQSTFQEGGQHS